MNFGIAFGIAIPKWYRNEAKFQKNSRTLTQRFGRFTYKNFSALSSRHRISNRNTYISTALLVLVFFLLFGQYLIEFLSYSIDLHPINSLYNIYLTHLPSYNYIK